jgi:hypothetical protein
MFHFGGLGFHDGAQRNPRRGMASSLKDKVRVLIVNFM